MIHSTNQTKNKKITYTLAILLGILLGSGCATTPKEEEIQPVEVMYQDAKQILDDGQYSTAVKKFEALVARYPYGRYAQQAELNIAYANYKDGETAFALAAVDRFLKQYPAHPSVDYALYLKGRINFLEDRSLFAGLSQQNIAERSATAAEESYDSFRELISRFPNSIYAEDARNRMVYLVVALADHELFIARYYYRRGAYLAAANRAQGVIKNFSHTNRVETALALMVAAYDKLGLTDLRNDAKRVLDRSFPQSNIDIEALYGDDDAWWKFW